MLIELNTAAAPTGIPTQPFPGLSYLSSLHRGDIVEIQGPSGSGKTHLLYYLICSCILPLRFGGWNKVSVVFDTDGTFDIHRLQTLLRTRLPPNFPSDPNTPGQIISVALRNVHIFRPKSSSQLAAGLANLSSYHVCNLPTSEIALLAVDSASSFYWLDRLAAERHTSPHLMNPATPLPTTSNSPLPTILTALRSFHRSHYPVILILNWVPSPISAAGNVPAVQLYKQHLPSSSTLVNRTSLFPDHGRVMPFLTHQITLDLTRIIPSSHSEEQRIASLTHVDIRVHVKTAVDHTELLLMQINPERVIITMADTAYTSNRDREEES
jgi:DNA-repair protein XRCC2